MRAKFAIPTRVALDLGFDAYASRPVVGGVEVRLWRGDESVAVTVPTEALNDPDYDLWSEIKDEAHAAWRRSHEELTWAADDFQTAARV